MTEVRTKQPSLGWLGWVPELSNWLIVKAVSLYCKLNSTQLLYKIISWRINGIQDKGWLIFLLQYDIKTCGHVWHAWMSSCHWIEHLILPYFYVNYIFVRNYCWVWEEGRPNSCHLIRQTDLQYTVSLWQFLGWEKI